MAPPAMTPVPPGSTIGIIGGGQLGRMIALAAARLGYRCHVFCPEPDSPAAQVAAERTVADYDDMAAIDRFAGQVDIVSYEFENIPTTMVDRIARQVAVYPDARVLAVTQDRLSDKDFVRGSGVGTAAFRRVDSLGDLQAALGMIGAPAVLKTRRLGYDGKGQAKIATPADAAMAWTRLAPAPCIVEQFVDFALEISVVAARGRDGAIATYVPVENRHIDHILATTIAPAPIAPAIAADATAIARTLIERLGVVGVLGVEMFVTRDGRVLVNELAPRVHNSGHWTMEACAASQFEQMVRAICGLPLGSPERHANAIMHNLIGADVARWPEILRDPKAHLHLYGKSAALPGRKMGHVTRLFALDETPKI